MTTEFIVGRNPVIEALRAKREMDKIWINEASRKGSLQELISLAEKNRVLIQFVPKRKLDQLSDTTNHQGVIASIEAYEYAELDDLFAKAHERKEQPFFVMLDEIEDPHNLGSMLRSADATGVHGIIIPRRRSASLTATVAKVSTGAIEYVPVVRVGNLAQTMEELKSNGLWFVGADANGQQDFREIDFDMPTCLVIGSEGKGLGRLIREKCDFLVSMPMVGQVTSLNASVAAAVFMYEVLRKRNPVGE